MVVVSADRTGTTCQQTNAISVVTFWTCDTRDGNREIGRVTGWTRVASICHGIIFVCSGVTWNALAVVLRRSSQILVGYVCGGGRWWTSGPCCLAGSTAKTNANWTRDVCHVEALAPFPVLTRGAVEKNPADTFSFYGAWSTWWCGRVGGGGGAAAERRDCLNMYRAIKQADPLVHHNLT